MNELQVLLTIGAIFAVTLGVTIGILTAKEMRRPTNNFGRSINYAENHHND